MNIAPLHPQEVARLKALQELAVLDTPAEDTYDNLLKLAANICEVPIALITLIDEKRQWFKAKIGIDEEELCRDNAFCSHCILGSEVFQVVDATQDTRFHDNPLVVNSPNIRSYAGAPILAKNKLPIGSVCVIDTKPRKLSDFQLDSLKIIAEQISTQMQFRLTNKLLSKSEQTLQEANKNLQQFFRIIAHDLRSPFHGFLSMTELLLSIGDSLSPEDLYTNIIALNESANETYNLLENLLEWSSIEIKTQEFSPEAVDAMELVEHPTRIFSTHLRKKEIQTTLAIPDGFEVYVDRKMIESVIRNLFANALKFTPSGGHISISGVLEGNNFKFTITDTGVGLTEEQRFRIMNQEHLKTSLGTDGEAGSGIGLHLVHTFLSRHSSKLEIVSKHDKGTSASFTVPLAKR